MSLVVRGRPHAAQRRLLLGVAMQLVGASWCAIVLVVTWRLGHAMLGPGFMVRLVEVAPVVIGSSLDALVTLALGAMLVLIGAAAFPATAGSPWWLHGRTFGVSRSLPVTADHVDFWLTPARCRLPGGRLAPSGLAAPNSGC